MFEVTSYEHPYIFVRCRRTFETYRFFVGADGTPEHDGARFDQGDARRTAIAYLHRNSRPRAA
jgi:hypothetical protein